jgi:hypothetical protein
MITPSDCGDRMNKPVSAAIQPRRGESATGLPPRCHGCARNARTALRLAVIVSPRLERARRPPPGDCLTSVGHHARPRRGDPIRMNHVRRVWSPYHRA